VIGNDIVDLEDRDAQPGARHPRFDRRVFSVGERRLLESAGSDTRLPWIFWSAKESAYKVARRRRPDLGFSPVRFAVELDAGWRGCVRHGEDVYPVRVDVRPDCVHAVATEPWIGVDEVWAEVRRPEPGETPGGMGEAGSAMRKRLNAGEPIDKNDGEQAKRRSQHNNYFTLPVTFAMISNHFAIAYNHHLGWLILCLAMGAGVTIRHYLNILYKEDRKEQRLLVAVVMAFGGVIGLSFMKRPEPVIVGPVDTPTAMAIIQKRCTTCHSVKPTYSAFVAPPAGFVMESTEQVLARAEKIVQRTSVSRDMPMGNATGMTDEERAMLRVWIEGQKK
jgi:hypothetical protein